MNQGSTVTVEDIALPSAPARIRLYRPTAEPAPRTILWIHGGAIVGASSLDQVESDAPCRAFAAVGYRLAPGTATSTVIGRLSA